jgi:hypothetical protein
MFPPGGISGTFLQVQPMLINGAFGMCPVRHLRYFPAKCNPFLLLAPFSVQETGEPSSGMQGATVVFALQAGVFKRFSLVLQASGRRYLVFRAAVSGCLSVQCNILVTTVVGLKKSRHAGTFAGSNCGRLKRHVALFVRWCRRDTSGGHDMARGNVTCRIAMVPMQVPSGYFSASHWGSQFSLVGCLKIRFASVVIMVAADHKSIGPIGAMTSPCR